VAGAAAKDSRGRTAQGCGQEDRGSQQIDELKTRLPRRDSAIYEESWRSRRGGSRSDRFAPGQGHDPWACVRGDPGGFFRDYLQLRFINSLERDPLFFIIDSVDLGGEQSGVVKLQLKLETYQKASG
jgi:hypothetical protein